MIGDRVSKWVICACARVDPQCRCSGCLMMALDNFGCGLCFWCDGGDVCVVCVFLFVDLGKFFVFCVCGRITKQGDKNRNMILRQRSKYNQP